MSVSVIAFMVFIERNQRRITIQYPKRQPGAGNKVAESSHLPLKINTAGVIPQFLRVHFCCYQSHSLASTQVADQSG